MSVADIFAFVFETQGADDVKRSIQDINKEIKELEERNGQLTEEEVKRYNTLKEEKKATDQLNNSSKDLGKSLFSLIGTYMGLRKVVSEVMGFAKGGEDLLLMANSANTSTQALERLGIALENYGGGLSSASSALSSLNQQMQDIKFGGGGAIRDVAIRYGISLSGKNGLATGEEMLYNIARRMEGLNTQAQLDLGQRLGLDSSMIALLQNGVAGLNKELERASKFTLYDKEDIENSRKFQMALRELRMSFSQVWGVISRSLLPSITTMTNLFAKLFSYIADHKGFVLGFFITLSAILGVMAIKAGIVALPFIKLIAIIGLIGTAIGLLVDDFITFQEGGDSAIGKVVNTFNDFLSHLKWTRDKIVEIFTGIWDSFVEQFADAFDKVRAGIEWIVDKYNTIKSYIPFFGDDEPKKTKSAVAVMMSTNNPLNSMPINSILNNKAFSTNIKIDNVEVNTQATDAYGISKGIGGALTKEFDDLLYQNTGGALA